MKLTFLGGAETVTGSKILLEHNFTKVLIDCGLFQGLKDLRLKNWEPLPIELNNLNAVVLTHAHLDHTGYLPLLVKNGFNKVVYCTPATKDLTEIILLDSGKIHEEDAKRANKYNYTQHKPAKPLYTVQDAKTAISFIKTIALNQWFQISDTIQCKFINSGHILGSASVLLKINGKIIAFSGDLGRKEPIILPKYDVVKNAEYVVIESTYGNRLHKKNKIKEQLLECINKTYLKKGILLIPTFSVERAQEIIYLLSVLKRENKLPNIPMYLDSPMGVNATNVYFKHQKNHKLSDEDQYSMKQTVQLISDMHLSRTLVSDSNPKIVLAGSGMLTGGRVLHYLDKIIGNQRNTILIVGFQAEGTRGRALLSKDSELKFFGKYHKVKAEVFKINEFSGHADQSEILDWLSSLNKPPLLTFINHGEPHQSQALKNKIKASFGWKCTVAKLNSEYYLDI